MRQGQLLEPQGIDKIRHIPTVIAQGRYDVVCPMKTAWDLKKVFPEVRALAFNLCCSTRLISFCSFV